jgi:alpha-galactosidase
MCGSLGVGGNLLEWSEEERHEAAYWIARYKSVREIIQAGDLFRLAPGVIQYLSKDQKRGVLFVFQTGKDRPGAIGEIQLQGLHPDWKYEVEGIPGNYSGSSWMSRILELPLEEFESTMREIKL